MQGFSGSGAIVEDAAVIFASNQVSFGTVNWVDLYFAASRAICMNCRTILRRACDVMRLRADGDSNRGLRFSLLQVRNIGLDRVFAMGLRKCAAIFPFAQIVLIRGVLQAALRCDRSIEFSGLI